MAMYETLDSLLEKTKKKVRTEFNRLGAMGFDELNVVNTKRTTKEMFDRLLAENEKVYLKVAKDAYEKAKKDESEETPIDVDWLTAVLVSFNAVTGYLYKQEAERKRLRLNEQVLTAREYDDRQMFNTSLRRTANLWWTQTSQYGITVVDRATLQAYKDMGVKRVRWNATVDKRTCKECRERHGKIYKISEVPEKTHYQCRCYLEPVEAEE
jgi:SPP1 gp7 family putative phage head morphogenesis protein